MVSHRTASGQTPEEVIRTDKPAPDGYTESKYIAEQLLGHAVQRLSIHASFARVGQIAGAVRASGLWNKTEWFPSLVISSLHVGAVPDSLGSTLSRIDWVPIDLLAEVLADLALGEHSEQGAVDVFHPLNLHPTTWEAIKPDVVDALYAYSGKKLETISLESWIEKVRKDMETTAGSHRTLRDGELQALLEKNPAVKLLGFYENLLAEKADTGNILDTKQTAEKSAKLQVVEGIKTEWIQKWIGEWMTPQVPN